MKKSREKLKEELLGQAEAEIEAILDWHQSHQKPTFTEMEEEMLVVRQKLSQEMTKSLLKDQESNRPGPGPKCKKCGKEMRYKGQKNKKLSSSLGEIEMERGYYYCPECRTGFFPSG